MDIGEAIRYLEKEIPNPSKGLPEEFIDFASGLPVQDHIHQNLHLFQNRCPSYHVY